MRKVISTLVLVVSLFASTVLSTSAMALTPKTGAACSKLGQQIHMNAKIYTCIKSGKKKVWSKGVSEYANNNSNNNGQGSSGQGGNSGNGQGTPNDQQKYSDTKFLYGKRIGDSCSTNGIFGFTGGGLAICRNKVVLYALQSDIPPAPAGGYKVRPSWYPTLAQQSGFLTEPTCSPSSIKFTSPVIPLDQLAPSVPYGAMIGGHVTPIDHAYLGVKSLYKPDSARTEADYVPVTSPADGIITSIGNLGSPTSIRVIIEHGCNVVTVYMVLNRLSGVLSKYAKSITQNGAMEYLNVKVKAGEEFGQQRDNTLDFNIWDGTQWLSGFANPFSYTAGDAWKPYTADPLPFFTPAIRGVMESLMQRTSAPRFGKIDYDVVGTASGNWFLDGTFGYSGRPVSQMVAAKHELQGGQTDGKNDYSWSHLAIAPDPVDTTKWIFSTGWWQNEAGDPHQFMLALDGIKPAPDKLSKSDGLVAYQLTSYVPVEPAGSPARVDGTKATYAVGYTLSPGMAQGVVALQVNDDGSLSVEVHPELTDPSKLTSFGASKRIYRH